MKQLFNGREERSEAVAGPLPTAGQFQAEQSKKPFPEIHGPGWLHLDSYLSTCVVREGFARAGDAWAQIEGSWPATESMTDYDRAWHKKSPSSQQMNSSGSSECLVLHTLRTARETRFPVGPGRGSPLAPSVAYAMGITDIDPFT